MLALQIAALLVGAGLTGHLAARTVDYLRAELAPAPRRRRYVAFKPARRA